MPQGQIRHIVGLQFVETEPLIPRARLMSLLSRRRRGCRSPAPRGFPPDGPFQEVKYSRGTDFKSEGERWRTAGAVAGAARAESPACRAGMPWPEQIQAPQGSPNLSSAHALGTWSSPFLDKPTDNLSSDRSKRITSPSDHYTARPTPSAEPFRPTQQWT